MKEEDDWMMEVKSKGSADDAERVSVVLHLLKVLKEIA
jgi:hypothetical protein